MDKAILLAVAAGLCTATSSVCQRLGASRTRADGFGLRLVVRLARRPVWLAGIGCMILGFAFQVSALHFGALALVQPILALELLFVFAYMAVLGSRRVQLRDWLAAGGMSAGLALFLLAAAPSGGRPHAPGSSWWLAGLATAGVVIAGLAVAFGLGRRRGAHGSRRAAVLGAATGLCWGFVAAVIKEFGLSTRGRGRGDLLQLAGLRPHRHRGSQPPARLPRAGLGPARGVTARVHDRRPSGGQPAGDVPVRRAHAGGDA